MRTCLGLAVIVAGAACGSHTPAPVVASDDDDVPAPPKLPEVVHLDLLADVTAVAPGQQLTLAARFDIEPEWHIYWLNPGGAGKATKASFAVPDGFVAGPARFPGPTSFEGASGFVMFGYKRHALVSSDVTAPDRLDGDDSLAFRVEASWLACLDECVRGKGAAELSLPVANEARPSAPANQTLFDRHRARLPVPWSQLAGVEQMWQRSGDELQLSIDLQGAIAVEYFPAADNQKAFAGQLAVARDDGIELRLRYSYKRRPTHARGVVRVTTSAGSTFYDMSVALPGDDGV